MSVGPLHIRHMLAVSPESLRFRSFAIRVIQELYESPVVGDGEEFAIWATVYAVDMGVVDNSPEDPLHWPAEMRRKRVPLLVTQLTSSAGILLDLPAFGDIPVE